jgi:hypothetical protein
MSTICIHRKLSIKKNMPVPFGEVLLELSEELLLSRVVAVGHEKVLHVFKAFSNCFVVRPRGDNLHQWVRAVLDNVVNRHCKASFSQMRTVSL